MAHIQLIEESDRMVLVASDDLTIGHAVQLREALLEALEKTVCLDIDLEDIGSVDLSFIQVLCAANKSFCAQGKKLRIIKTLPDHVLKTLGDIDLDPENCDSSLNTTCLWSQGGKYTWQKKS